MERISSIDTSKSEGGTGPEGAADAAGDGAEAAAPGKLSSSKLAQKLGIKTPELLEQFVASGFLMIEEGKHRLTQKGMDAGCEFIAKSRFGPYFLWPEGCRSL